MNINYLYRGEGKTNLITYKIDVGFVVVVKSWHNFLKIS